MQIETRYYVHRASAGTDAVEVILAEVRSRPGNGYVDVQDDLGDSWITRAELLARPGGAELIHGWLNGDEGAYERATELERYAAELGSELTRRGEGDPAVYDALVTEEIVKGVPVERIEWAIGSLRSDGLRLL